MLGSRIYIAYLILVATNFFPYGGISQTQETLVEFPDSIFSFLEKKIVANDCNNFLTRNELLLLKSNETKSCKVKVIAESLDGVLNGKIQYFVFDTVLLAEGFMFNEAPHGLASVYRVGADYKTDQIVSRLVFIMNFNQGKRSGPTVRVDQDYVYPTLDSLSLSIPVVANISSWQNNDRHGPEIVYDLKGNIRTYRLYDKGEIVDGKYLHSNLEIVQYKDGKAVKIWNYSFNPPGRLVPSGFKGLNLGYTFFNFNKFKFPIKKLARGKKDYQQFINSQLAK